MMTTTKTIPTPSHETMMREFAATLPFMVLLSVLLSVMLVKGFSGEIMTLLDTLTPVIIMGAMAVVPTGLVIYNRLVNYRKTEIIGPVIYAAAFLVSFFLCSALGLFSMNFFYLFHLLLPLWFLHTTLKGYTKSALNRGIPIS